MVGLTSVLEFIQAIEDDLHRARHEVISFGEVDEHPVVGAAWNVGLLFGMHLAIQYPELVPKLDKMLWSEGALPAPAAANANRSADLIAAAIVARWLPKLVSDDEAIDKLIILADRYDNEPMELVTPEEFWPLPKEWPEEYQGA